ncbi:hypothetical protein RBE51_22405 [Pseudomonas taiwanensis]|uniref:hypothetical protein n=1 Tax=Pseudomonas taiwanensis TaxID=470150 RepID=UPI0028DD9FE0|nr:hypothetical protein [Pseudomonas taiwanensis]MDT8925538.1 hypothetical protein [Pseudomonas taiwanensis]
MSNKHLTPEETPQHMVWPEYLVSAEAIAAYVAVLSPYEVSLEQIEEQYFGCRAKLTWIELDTLLLYDSDHHEPSQGRQEAVDSLPIGTMPPLLVEDFHLEDGYHRLRKLRQDNMTHHWAYVIEEAPEPSAAPAARKPSRWDEVYDQSP